MSVTQKLFHRGLIKPPRFVQANIAYETIMGSEAYGCADTANKSDTDIYGFCIPDRGMVFPHLDGQIIGFGRQRQTFDVYQQHHVVDKNEGGMQYDLAIYGIVKYFALCMECNPNMIDSLYTPERCVLHRSNISRMVRDRRKLFLHKKAWHTFRGYAHQQHNKMMFKGRKELREFQHGQKISRDTTPDQFGDILNERYEAAKKASPNGWVDHDPYYSDLAEYKRLFGEARALPENPKRAESVERYGYDVKFAYHVVRLMNQVEQIMTEYDLDLERCREQLKSIRRGEWTIEQITSYLHDREKQLEGLYDSSKIPHGPDEDAIKQLLMDCLEEHFGSLKDVIVQPGASEKALRDIQDVLDRNASLFR